MVSGNLGICAICTGPIDNGQATRTSCLHVFHRKCVEQVQECPLCKHPLKLA